MGEILVINLADRADRRALVAETFGRAGVGFRFVEAVDGRRAPPPMAYDRKRRLRLAGKDLTAGELGCYLSHLKAMRLLVEEGHDWAVICEDDIVVAPDLGQVIASLAAMHERLSIVKLESSEDRGRKARELGTLTPDHSLVRVSNVTHGAAGYFITRRAAERFLRRSKRFFRPVDVDMARSWETGIDVLAVNPWPIEQDKAVPSSIETARFETPAGEAKFGGLGRWLNRQRDSVAKRAGYLVAWPGDRAFARR